MTVTVVVVVVVAVGGGVVDALVVVAALVVVDGVVVDGVVVVVPPDVPARVTVTVKLAVAVFALESWAVQVTVVTPIWNASPPPLDG
jgi:hypothetical protein